MILRLEQFLSSPSPGLYLQNTFRKRWLNDIEQLQSEILTKLSALDNEFRFSTSPRNLLEITLVSLCDFEMTELNELKMQVKLLEKKIK